MDERPDSAQQQQQQHAQCALPDDLMNMAEVHEDLLIACLQRHIGCSHGGVQTAHTIARRPRVVACETCGGGFTMGSDIGGAGSHGVLGRGTGNRPARSAIYSNKQRRGGREMASCWPDDVRCMRVVQRRPGGEVNTHAWRRPITHAQHALHPTSRKDQTGSIVRQRPSPPDGSQAKVTAFPLASYSVLESARLAPQH